MLDFYRKPLSRGNIHMKALLIFLDIFFSLCFFFFVSGLIFLLFEFFGTIIAFSILGICLLIFLCYKLAEFIEPGAYWD